MLKPSLKNLFEFFSSLRLTVVCLALGVLVVFIGTLAQVNEGLYQAQARYFRSFFVWWGPAEAGWRVPVFPGGYLLGTVLLLNLLAAHLRRFRFTTKKLGIHVLHAGVIALLAGQLATDLLSTESHLRLREGETKNYSESHLDNELVFVTDAADADREEVISIPESLLARRTEIRHEKLPFTVQVKQYHANCRVSDRAPMVDTDPPAASQGIGAKLKAAVLPPTRKMDDRNFPGAVLELLTAQGSLGTWFVSTWLVDSQEIKVGDRVWRVAFRWERNYTPFSMQLLKATHEEYRGTRIPKNFQSRVRVENPRTGENREVDIYMNNPLRYAGLTFYQYQMGRDERDAHVGTSTLQVVRNPSWLTPYVGCVLVAAGLILQFMMHLVGFITKRRAA